MSGRIRGQARNGGGGREGARRRLAGARRVRRNGSIRHDRTVVAQSRPVSPRDGPGRGGDPGTSDADPRSGLRQRLTGRAVGRTVRSVTASDRCAAPTWRGGPWRPVAVPGVDPHWILGSPTGVTARAGTTAPIVWLVGAPDDRSSPIRIAFASTYPPRRCGIATFTNDLSRAVDGREIVALTPPDHSEPYPAEVHHRIRRDEWADYPRVARALDRCPIDAVSIQHEYGIWGGDDGEHVIDFVNALRAPAVATLHTVLRHPTPHQRRVLVELVDATSATVVMSDAARSLLTEAYGVPADRIEVIPHGVPELPFVAPDTLKPGLGLDGREIILSFGLLGPGKGYELAIAAMPAVVAVRPNVQYIILGATHPDLIRSEGEAYRASLEARIAALGMTRHVRLIDQFVGRRELARWLEAADVFVTPYPNLDQIVSGTMSYAMSAGKAIVSTPYAYAAELLADGRGVLVEPASTASMSEAFIGLLEDPERRNEIGGRAYAHSRGMIWPEVGAAYRRLFARVVGRPAMATNDLRLGHEPRLAVDARVAHADV